MRAFVVLVLALFCVGGMAVADSRKKLDVRMLP